MSAGHSSSRIWTAIRIVNVRLRFVILMLVVGLIAGNWDRLTNHFDRWTRPAPASQDAEAPDSEYYCPMHPNIVRSETGSCPICGMPLARRDRTARKPLPEGVLA